MYILYFGCLATRFFINPLLCVTMVTMLVKDIPQDVWLCAMDCYQQNPGYINCLQPLDLSFKDNRSAKKYQKFLESLILRVVSMVTVQGSEK